LKHENTQLKQRLINWQSICDKYSYAFIIAPIKFSFLQLFLFYKKYACYIVKIIILVKRDVILRELPQGSAPANSSVNRKFLFAGSNPANNRSWK